MDNIPSESEHTVQATIAEIWNTNRYTEQELLDNGIAPERFGQYLLFQTTSFVERGVCNDHISGCELCGDVYVQPTEYDNIGHIPENLRPRSYQTTATVSWNHYDRVCLGCEDDAALCDRCGELNTWDNTIRIDSGYAYCDDCQSACGIFYCDECDEHHENECQYSSSNLIHDYSYKPDPAFKYLSDIDGDLGGRSRRQGKVFMGFELEVEAQSSREAGAQLTVDVLGEDYVYLKNDGSLSNGFEIVSHPATLAYHKTRSFEVLDTLAKEHNYTSWRAGTCGLHVHISREAFDNPSHIWKFAHLIANNKDEMIRLAGRNSDRWATFDGIRGDIGSKAKGSTYVNRYEAINFQNSNTIELRFFRGSLLPQRVFMALELTDAVAEYTRTLSANDVIRGGLEFGKFAEWVSTREQYSNLLSYLTKYNLVPATQVTL
jgi:hypothetical protein